MATTPSTFKVFTNRLFGSFKSTEAVESDQKALEAEYEEQLAYAHSAEWSRFQELKAWVGTKEHIRVKQEVNALTYKSSGEFKEEQELKRMRSGSTLKNYLRQSETDNPAFFKKMEQSGLVEEFNTLKAFVESTDYKSNRRAYRKENSPEYQKEVRFNELKSSVDLKRYFQLLRLKPLKDYFSLEGSPTLARYNELKDKVGSAEFAERKKYLLSKNKFEQTEAYQKLQELKTLEASAKVRWFLKVKDSPKFNSLKQWTLAFHDDFDGKTIDSQRWLTKFFWGDALINKSYSFATDEQHYSDGGNLELRDSVLRIATRKEKAEGLAWDKKLGFIPKSFGYTSGVINTGHIYRQAEGKVEAKVRMSCADGVSHAFYLVGDRMLPELDVFLKSDAKQSSISAAYFWGNGSGKVRKSVHRIGGLKLDSQFYIMGAEWDAKNIVWTINGTPYKVQPNLNPNIPLYLVFASGVNGQADGARMPAYMEIDWVKCWKKA